MYIGTQYTPGPLADEIVRVLDTGTICESMKGSLKILNSSQVQSRIQSPNNLLI